MSKCLVDSAVTYAKSQVGYKEGKNNYNKYAAELDSINYFTPQKKQNVAWCAIFQDDVIYHASGKDKAKTYKVLYQPSKNNLSAGCVYFANYLKKNKAWYTSAKVGDMVFFNSLDSKGKVKDKFVHVGIVVSVSVNTITTIEGNKNNQVSKCSYNKSLLGTKIEGYGRPKYDSVEPSPTPAPTPTPTPTPTPKPSNKYKVKTKTGVDLRIRAARSVKSKQVGSIPNGKVITVTDISNGWGKTTYNKVTGYVSMTYLVKV